VPEPPTQIATCEDDTAWIRWTGTEGDS